MPDASGLVEGAINLLKSRRQVVQKSRSGGGRCNALGRPGKELHLKSLLQPPDCVTQSRLGHTQLCRSPGKASFIGDDGKHSEFVQFALI